MKSRLFIVIGTVLLLSIYALFRAGRNPESGSHVPDPPVATSLRLREKAPSGIDGVRKKYNEVFDAIELTEEEIAARPEGIDKASWLASVFFHRANVKDKNGDVRFYGKVVDQNNQPIDGVEIIAYSKQYTESIKEQVLYGGEKIDTKRLKVFTDASGLFLISGYRARNLRFESIEKFGYTMSSKLPGFSYSPSYSVRHVPDEFSPVVFSMWKKGETEPLVKRHWRKRIVPDGRSYSFDLENSRIVKGGETGDFKIKINADYRKREGTVNYPWTVEVEIPEGGATIAKSPHPYMAPEFGYKTNLFWNSKTNSKSWSRDLKQTVYVKGKGGKFYASVTLSVKIFHTNSASIVMDVLLNPAGSRNLEYDASKRIE